MVSSFALVMALALLPAAGNIAGGLLAETWEVSARTLSLALHLAAGIVLAVVGLELVPEALNATPPWVPILAFVTGGALFMGLERLIKTLKTRLGSREGSTGPWAIFAGVSLDLFSDGVMIGTGSVISPALGLLLAAGQVPADIPEGFAASATLRRAGVPRRARLLVAASFTLPVLIGAALGYLALCQQIQREARTLGLTAAPERARFVQVGIDAADVPATRSFWQAVLGYEPDPRQDVTDLVDPRRLGPVLFFQPLDREDTARRAQRNRLHLEAVVAHDDAEARTSTALRAGGSILRDRGPAGWTLADPEGNEVDVVVGSGREEGQV